MKRIAFSDIQNLVEYEKIRDRFRQQIIDLKKVRRIEVGDKIAIVFENRETLTFQIQEMMRAERIVHDDKVQDEIDTYNELIPGENELSGTLFIQLRESNKIREELLAFLGLDKEMVQLEIDSQVPIVAKFEEGHSEEDRISSVHYIRFKFDRDQVEAFRDFNNKAVLAVVHPNYWVKTDIPDDLRRSLLEDLVSG